MTASANEGMLFTLLGLDTWRVPNHPVIYDRHYPFEAYPSHPCVCAPVRCLWVQACSLQGKWCWGVTRSARKIMQEEAEVGLGKTEHHVLCWVRGKEAADG